MHEHQFCCAKVPGSCVHLLNDLSLAAELAIVVPELITVALAATKFN